MEFVRQIKTIRKERKLSQRELAERVGVTQAYLCNIEKGKSKPPFSLVNDIFEELGYKLLLIRNGDI